jgi:uncharacterized protein (TIGR02996 family)
MRPKAGGPMTEEEELVAWILNSPNSPFPRLVYADWLEENGDPGRAELL